RADIGNEADQPRKKSDQKPEIQPDKRESRCIIDTKDQAECPLPPNEPGRCRVNVASDLPDVFQMIARDESIDILDHPVPVEEQVEGYDGRHHEQADDIDDCKP